MSNIKWKAHFSYQADVGESVIKGSKVHLNHSIPVLEFSVKGGTVQTINLESTNNSSIQLELQEAKTHKNLSLALMLTDAFRRTQIDDPGFYWVYDLLELAARDLPFSMQLQVNGQIGNAVTQSYRLEGKNVRIQQPTEPAKPGGPDYKVVVVRLDVKEVEVFQGFQQKARFIEPE